MKKRFFAAVTGAAMLALSGCTSVESTQKFNAINLAGSGEVAKCQSHVEIPGYFFLGLPVLVGSAHGDGQFTMFKQNLTTENAMYLLTKEVKSKGAHRLTNVTVSSSSTPMVLPPFFSYRVIQASGTGVAPGGTGVPQAAF